MGVEKQLVSSKMREENVRFLAHMARTQEPYEVSQSSLIDLCVSLVRVLYIAGEIALNPQALQVQLRQLRPTVSLNGDGEGLASVNGHTPNKQALLNFFSLNRRKAEMEWARKSPFFNALGPNNFITRRVA